jgi:hypothetical protein
LYIHVGAHPAMDDDLGAGVARWLEQHRVHVGVRLDTGGDGLQRLGAADLATIARDCAIQRHVLRLERRDLHAALHQ